MKISTIFKTYESLIDTEIDVQGWVTTSRSQKDLTFVKINDGSHPDGLQLVVNGSEKYSVGSSLQVKGKQKNTQSVHLYKLKAI
jgi:aspartyl/asparaginyl-tRNA synthetase